MHSSQLTPNFLQGSRHTAQVYDWANRCSTAQNEGMPIVVLGLLCCVIRVLWLWIWYNTMLSSGETAIKVALHAAGKPTNITSIVSGVPKAGWTQSGYMALSILGTGNKCTICEEVQKGK